MKTNTLNRTFRPKGAHNARPDTWKALNRLIFQTADTWLSHANFWSKVDVSAPEECWEWRAGRVRGYGRFKTDQRVSELSHRVAYALANRVNPEANKVCHKCDNPGCVNPNHLFLGTQADNIHDMRRKGRGSNGNRRGERNNRAKLSRSDVTVIRKRISKGETNTAIAADYRVSHSTISAIRRGKTWTTPPTREAPQGGKA